MSNWFLIVLLMLFIPKGFNQTSKKNLKPLFYPIPGKIYPVDFNLSVLDEIESMEHLLKEDSLNKGVVFYFFYDEQKLSRKKADEFMQLLKDSLSRFSSDFRLHFQVHRTAGTIFINNGEKKYPLTHLNALVYSNDQETLKTLFLNGAKSRIDTTVTKLKKFNFQFEQIMITSEVDFEHLYLFHSKTNTKGAACNPDEDLEISSILKRIYMKLNN